MNLISIEKRPSWIPIGKCKKGWAYYIHARNAKVGIYDDKKNGGFTISRHKFNDTYLFEEIHWDTGEPYGTVKPIRLLEKAPKFASDAEKLAWLNKKSDSIKEDPWIQK